MLNRFFINICKFLGIILIFFTFSTSIVFSADPEEEKKDCQYCNEYKTLNDWPVSERPKEFIYEEVDYPKGMFRKSDSKKSFLRKKAAGGKVYKRFVKSKGSLNTKQHDMIRDMAYFEALYNETLNSPKSSVESVEGLKKGREAMRMSLKISPSASTSEAVMKFWATGKMLSKTYKLNKKKKKRYKNKLLILILLKELQF